MELWQSSKDQRRTPLGWRPDRSEWKGNCIDFQMVPWRPESILLQSHRAWIGHTKTKSSVCGEQIYCQSSQMMTDFAEYLKKKGLLCWDKTIVSIEFVRNYTLLPGKELLEISPLQGVLPKRRPVASENVIKILRCSMLMYATTKLSDINMKYWQR